MKLETGKSEILNRKSHAKGGQAQRAKNKRKNKKKNKPLKTLKELKEQKDGRRERILKVQFQRPKNRNRLRFITECGKLYKHCITLRRSYG